MNDYYSTLSLSSNASVEEIKRNYKRLALQFHPDKNPDDTVAEERFKEINEAYQILSDPIKKNQYDQILKYGFAQQIEQPTYQRSYYKGEKVRPEPRRVNLLYVYIFLGFAIFITAGFYFFSFMEKKAAKSIYADAEHLYLNESNPKAALEYLQLALEKDASLSDAYFLTGKILYQEAKDYQASLYYFENAIAEGNGVSDSIGVYYYWRGKNRIQLENYIEGVSDLESAFAYMPDNKELYLLLGDIYLYKLRNYEKAIFYYDQVLIDAPQNYDALLGKGVTLQKKSAYEEAAKYFDNAAYVKSNSPELLYYQAIQALNYKQDTIKACELWAKARTNGVKEATFYINKFCD